MKIQKEKITHLNVRILVQNLQLAKAKAAYLGMPLHEYISALIYEDTLDLPDRFKLKE